MRRKSDDSTLASIKKVKRLGNTKTVGSQMEDISRSSSNPLFVKPEGAWNRTKKWEDERMNPRHVGFNILKHEWVPKTVGNGL